MKNQSPLYRNKYRTTSIRLQSWNYAGEGMYFITICTKNRVHYFGEIVGATNDNVSNDVTATPLDVAMPCMASLHPTEIGKIAMDEWFKTPELRPDMNLELGEFVVMPDHIHGIIIIRANEYNLPQNRDEEYQNIFGPQSKNLASVIRGYKSAVTAYARKNDIEFNWQTGFYERIIRSMDEYMRVSEYIINNRGKWYKKYNPL